MWQRVETSLETKRYLRGTHDLWSNVTDGKLIFTVLPIGTTPKNGDGGYYDIATALAQKGMLSFTTRDHLKDVSRTKISPINTTPKTS